MAPEIWKEQKITSACDVYSFAFVLYSILTSKEPCMNYNQYEFIMKAIHNMSDQIWIQRFHHLFNHSYKDADRKIHQKGQHLMEKKTNEFRCLLSIESSFFRICENLKKISIPPGVETIGKSWLRGDNHIESITLPENLTIIEKSTFKRCVKLQNVNTSPKVVKIQIHLKMLIIPYSVTEIQSNEFRECSSLTHIYYYP